MMPTDCSVLRTITILPNIRISRELSRFYAHIEAGPKVFHPLMSKLMCVKDLLTLASSYSDCNLRPG